MSPPVDLSAVARRARLAYRAEGDGWRGGHATYAATVRGRQLSVVPRHHDPATAATVGAPLTLEATSIARGPARVAPGAPVASVGPDGALRLAAAGVTEELRNGEEGVEQQWTFAARPAGAGDLVVRVRAQGLEYAGRTDLGLHFADPASGLGFRYGRAAWIDAAGRREPVPAEVAGDEIVLRVPAAVVDAAGYPAVLDPLIGPEVGVGQAVLGHFTGGYGVKAAFDGSNYLLVWEDHRDFRGRRRPPPPLW